MGLWATWAAPGLSWLRPSEGQQGRRQKRAGTFSRGHVVLVRKIVLCQAGYVGVRPGFREAFSTEHHILFTVDIFPESEPSHRPLLLAVFGGRVLLCSPGWIETYYVARLTSDSLSFCLGCLSAGTVAAYVTKPGTWSDFDMYRVLCCCGTSTLFISFSLCQNLTETRTSSGLHFQRLQPRVFSPLVGLW